MVVPQTELQRSSEEMGFISRSPIRTDLDFMAELMDGNLSSDSDCEEPDHLV